MSRLLISKRCQDKRNVWALPPYKYCNFKNRTAALQKRRSKSWKHVTVSVRHSIYGLVTCFS